MNFVDFVIIAVIVAILGFAVWFVYKSKKSGKKCIGCPEGGCAGCSCGCGQKTE